MKHIIIINGKGGCGKDTLVSVAAKEFNAWNKSAIDPIKKIASLYGYKEEEKTDKARKFLSDLKKCFVEWNDLPMRYLKEKLVEFREDGYSDLMFIHIREPEEIDKFKEMIMKESASPSDPVVFDNIFKVHTLLIKRDDTDEKRYGNDSDDNVENYNYDFTFVNNRPISASKYAFLLFLEEEVLKTEK